MERLMIEYDGQYVPKKLCTVNCLGEADDCDACDEYCENNCENCAIQECFNVLAEYEKTDITPEQIREIDKLYAEKCREAEEWKAKATMNTTPLEKAVSKIQEAKLFEYQQAEENGLLLRLPCKVGDTVYRVSLNDVKEYKVFAINIGIRENASSCAILTKNNRGAVIDFETIDFGKTVFLTRKEAEAKLAEVESGNERDYQAALNLKRYGEMVSE